MIRRVNLQPTDLLEVIDPRGLSVLKVRVLQGQADRTQVFVFSQPVACCHLDPTQPQVAEILALDPPFGACHE